VTRPLLVGVQLPEVEWEATMPEVLAMARAAEAVGFDSVWVGDHLIYDLPVGPRGPWEAWTSLAAIAAVTDRILIGPLVASIGFHEPTMLAKQAATVDAISNGAGWNEREYAAYGFPFDHRVSRFDEAFTIIRTLLRDGEIDFHGAYYAADKCVLHPRAARAGGPPIMIGSTSPRMLAITAAHMEAWNLWYTLFGNTADGFAAAKAEADAALVSHGRNPADVEAGCTILVQLPDGDGRQAGSEAPEIAPVTGSPREIADQLRAFADAGAQHVQLVLDPITRPSIEFFADVFFHLDET
jgi:alkanesulfonate monooxygenase SsuD/methylene tetrahydromethanopterin reductase-like flavin-dependent oxidoreductase (luciferase family)